MDDFLEHREEVRNYIGSGMMEQGANAEQACVETICIMFWKQRDVENLYKCINSDLEPNVIASIVAHDYNGLSKENKGFLPKSRQFERRKDVALSH